MADNDKKLPNVGKLTPKEQLKKEKLMQLVRWRNGILLADEADELRALFAKEGARLVTKVIHLND